jgi:hypothetical protein
MSLDATFWIDSPATPADMQRRLAAVPDFSPLDPIKPGPRLSASGLIITIFPTKAPTGYLEDAGIAARLSLSFENSDKTRVADWTRNVFRAVAALMTSETGDALLIYAPDYPVLLRKSGDLLLDERRSFWSESASILPLLPAAHRFGRIPLS